jgi:hypothetical protein
MACIPVAAELDLKALAAHSSNKRAEMVPIGGLPPSEPAASGAVEELDPFHCGGSIRQAETGRSFATSLAWYFPSSLRKLWTKRSILLRSESILRSHTSGSFLGSWSGKDYIRCRRRAPIARSPPFEQALGPPP